MNKRFSIGDTVRLKSTVFVGTVPPGREDNKTARICAFLSGIEGGVRTDRDLRGMLFWNTEDLVRVRKAPK